jgi:hypothetical protein
MQKKAILNISNSSIKILKTFELSLCCKNNTEESGFFVNCFGLKQVGLSALSGPKKSRNIKKINGFFLNSLNNLDEINNLKKSIVFPLGDFVFDDRANLTLKLLGSEKSPKGKTMLFFLLFISSRLFNEFKKKSIDFFDIT